MIQHCYISVLSPNGTLGLAALNDDTVDWLKRTALNIWRQDQLKRSRNMQPEL